MAYRLGLTYMLGEGLVEDFVESISEAINDFLCEILINLLTGCMNIIDSVISYTVNQTNNDFVSFINSSPQDFRYGSMVSGILWTRVRSICDNAVVPIAGYILTIVLLNDLIQLLLQGNSFKDFEESVLFKWVVKCIIGITLVNNTYVIATGLFAFGTEVTNTALGFIGTSASFPSADFESALGSLELVELLMLLLPMILTVLAVFLMLGAIILVLLQRIIECFMYLGVSLIPMATLMNETWSGIGKNWIKSVLALSFQGLFIIIALGIFNTVYRSTIRTIINSITSAEAADFQNSATFSVLMLLGFSGALIFTIMRSGQISKSIFNAG